MKRKSNNRPAAPVLALFGLVSVACVAGEYRTAIKAVDPKIARQEATHARVEECTQEYDGEYAMQSRNPPSAVRLALERRRTHCLDQALEWGWWDRLMAAATPH